MDCDYLILDLISNNKKNHIIFLVWKEVEND